MAEWVCSTCFGAGRFEEILIGGVGKERECRVCGKVCSTRSMHPVRNRDLPAVRAAVEGQRCWLVGQQTYPGVRLAPSMRYVVVEARRVGPAAGGMQTVDLRTGGCRGARLETVPADKVYATREAAEARRAELEADNG